MQFQQTPLSTPAPKRTQTGNQSALFNLNASAPVIQRVPKLWEIALLQTTRKLQELDSITLNTPNNYIVAMTKIHKNPIKYGFSADVFGPDPYPAAAQTYFINCIQKYYGISRIRDVSDTIERGEGLGSDAPSILGVNEERMLGKGLNSHGTDFNQQLKTNQPLLAAVLTAKLFPGGNYLFAPTAPRVPGTMDTFRYHAPLAAPHAPGLVTAAAEGLNIANRMMERNDLKLPPVHLISDTAGGRMGGFQSHFNNAPNPDTLLYFDNTQDPHPNMKINAATNITSNTVIPPGTCVPAGVPLPRTLPGGGVIPHGTIIPKETIIQPGTVIPPGSHLNPVNRNPTPPARVMPPGVTLSPGTAVPKRTFIDFTAALNLTALYQSPDGITIPAGTRIPAGTMIRQTIIPPVTFTNRRTFPHELAHQLETHLGVEDMVKLYRGLYARTTSARTSNYTGLAPANLEKGITTTGPAKTKRYGLQLLNPDMSGSIAAYNPQQALDDINTYGLQNQGYFGTLYRYPAASGGVQSPNAGFETEFLSTTAEMLADEVNANILIDSDPYRIALFLKFANPVLYSKVKLSFHAMAPRVNLDQLLHID